MVFSRMPTTMKTLPTTFSTEIGSLSTENDAIRITGYASDVIGDASDSGSRDNPMYQLREDISMQQAAIRSHMSLATTSK